MSPAKARRPILTRKATAGEAFQAIGASALAQITANARVLRTARRPEAVHQLRVGVRRLRTAISLFEPMLADERRGLIQAELKWITGELDAARNLDVYIAETFRPAATVRPQTPGLATLGASLLRAQTEAYDGVEIALRSARFSSLTLEIAAWIETGAWADSLDPALAGPRERPATKLATEVLGKHLRKIIKAGRDLDKLSPEDRHHLRIRAKKLRYAGDFFASLYDGRAAGRHKAMTLLLADFQDGLGVLNDIAVGAGLVTRLVGAAPDPSGLKRKPDPAQAFAAGQICVSREAEAPAAMAAALKAYAKLAKAKPYW
jgi:CHAD domain-containing protein